jgi:cell division protein FtsQ
VRLLACTGLGTLGFAVWALQVREVRIIGLHELQPAFVARVAALRGGERMLFTRMSVVERRVESLPGVKQARVRRVLPATVVVSVTERVPLARLDAHPELAADADGVLFAAPGGLQAPLLEGWRGRAAAGRSLDAATKALLAAYSGFPAQLRAASGIRAGPDVVVTLQGATEVRFGRPVALEAKASAAVAVLQDAQAKGMALEYVDVRAPRTPVVGTRPVASPTPAPVRSPVTSPRRATPKPATPKPTTPKPATQKPSRR